MDLYRHFVLPRLTHMVMRRSLFDAYRMQVVPQARGTVLEIGIGSAPNSRLYGRSVGQVVGLDPSEELLRIARRTTRKAPRPVALVCGTAEQLPLPDGSVDTVVSTWTLCSIPDPIAALREVRRVLAPAGDFLFVEHGQSPDAGVRRWQDRLTPAWKRCAGGCHLNRKIDDLVEAAGLRLEELNTGYMRGPRLLTYLYRGRARAG